MPILGAALLLSAAGCNYLGDATAFDPRELDQTPGWVAVREVPVVLQKDRTDCGAAALSMVLAYWQIPLTPEEVKGTCLVIEDLGIKAKDLRDLARERGLQAYLIHGRWEDLEVELRREHPVIVGLVKPYVSGALTHYEVVVAVHPERRIVVTHDPGHGWRQNSLEGLRKEWEPAGFLTLVFFRKETGPEAQGEPGERGSR
jgi:ABC-type bacteriocin/lantibiotic exporter with double-glycine peptidase domain